MNDKLPTIDEFVNAYAPRSRYENDTQWSDRQIETQALLTRMMAAERLKGKLELTHNVFGYAQADKVRAIEDLLLFEDDKAKRELSQLTHQANGETTAKVVSYQDGKPKVPSEIETEETV